MDSAPLPILVIYLFCGDSLGISYYLFTVNAAYHKTIVAELSDHLHGLLICRLDRYLVSNPPMMARMLCSSFIGGNGRVYACRALLLGM